MVNGDRTFFTYEEKSVCRKFEVLICQYSHQSSSICFVSVFLPPMGTNYAPFMAKLLLYSNEAEFLRSINKSNNKLAKKFNLSSHYTDDLISIINSRLKLFLKDIYLEELVVLETSELRNVLSYLDLLIDISSVNLVSAILTKGMHLILILSFS